MNSVELGYWLRKAPEPQVKIAYEAALFARNYWMANGLHELDTIVASDVAAEIEIIAMGGLRVVGRG